MGISKAIYKMFLIEGKQRPFHGSMLTLGRVDVAVTYNELLSIAKWFQLPLLEVDKLGLSPKEDRQEKGHISDQAFFQALGFSNLFSLDVSPYQGASILFDMNQPNPLPECENRFDVILDSGTMEHVFHVPNFLHNVYRMLKLGGRIIHTSPTSNLVDHGFYSFSPTFFWDFYSANQFEINSIQIFNLSQNPSAPVEVSDYLPGRLPLEGALDDHLYLTCCIATKTRSSTGNLIPQQFKYVNLEGWGPNGTALSFHPEAPNKSIPSVKNKIKLALGRVPLLYSLASGIYRIPKSLMGSLLAYRIVKKKRPGLKIAARY